MKRIVHSLMLLLLMLTGTAQAFRLPHPDNSDLPPKNRVWENFNSPGDPVGDFGVQTVEPHLENQLVATITVPGITFFLTRDPIGYGDGPNVYCYVHCNPITSFDAWGLETVEEYDNQIAEIDATYGEEYGNHRSEHWSKDNMDKGFNGWDSKESYDTGKDILNNWREAKAPLQSARDDIIQSVRALNEAFSKEIAEGKFKPLDASKIDDDFMNPQDLYDFAGDKMTERAAFKMARNMIKYYAIAKMLTSITGTSEGPDSPFVPDDAYTKNAPKQVEPGIRSLKHYKWNPKTQEWELSDLQYDEYGRQIERTDHTTHGRPESHTDPHSHTTEYGPGYSPTGKESGVQNK